MEDSADNTTVIKVLNSFHSYLSQVDLSGHDNSTTILSNSSNALQSQYLRSLQVEEQVDQSHLKSKLYHLECENQKLALSAKRARIETELELNTSTCNYERELSKNRELALQLKHAQEREAELLAQLEAVAATSHRHCDAEIQRLTKDREQLLQTQEKLNVAESKVLDLQRALMNKDMKMTILSSDHDEAQSRLDEQERLCQEAKEKVRELEGVQAQCVELELKNKSLEQQLHKMEEDTVVVRSMRSQLARLLDAEKQNKALQEEIRYHRETQEKTALLKEEVLSLRSKTERFQQLQEQHAHLLVENEDLQNKLKTWESLDQVTGMKAKNPTDLNRQLSLLQHEQLLQAQKNCSMGATVRDAVRNRHRLEEEKIRLTAQLHEAMERKQQADNHAQNLQRRCMLLTRERDGMRGILDSYDEVTTTTGFTTQLSQRVREAEATAQRLNAHTLELEKQLGTTKMETFNYKLKAQKLEADLALEHSRVSAAARDFSRDEADQLCKKIEDLQEKLNTVTEEKGVLEMRLEMRSLQGDYDPRHTRVLQMKMNPLAAAQEEHKTELLRLQDECDRLRERVRQLEQGGAVATAAPAEQPGDSESALPSRVIADLRKQLESAELKNQRLKEVFQMKIQEFRNAYYSLTGYQMAVSTEGQYKLMSMYAERENDYLLFKNAGQMQLLETEFSQSLSDLISLHLHQQKSIPVFLSAITLELFSRQTCPTMSLAQHLPQ
uniref:Mitotic spindle assembly checkpoint protein MAD1 n=1 Tax=Petromyzon marinus TaxID=7757 RepID=A0AAJ7TXU1_PETMA|nr:mitotic spindle assembly checkpoint protein MAD1 [Petromyzon marinus]